MRQIVESLDTARILFNDDYPPGTGIKQRPCETPGTRADFNHVAVRQISSRSGNPVRQISIEKKVLPKPFPGGQPIPFDDIPQRRQRGLRQGPAPFADFQP